MFCRALKQGYGWNFSRDAYYKHKKRGMSARSVQDAVDLVVILDLWEQSKRLLTLLEKCTSIAD